MIVCSCNALSEREFLRTLDTEIDGAPRSAAQAYRCLGCSPQCGRCLRTVKALLDEAREERGLACGSSCRTAAELRHDLERGDEPFLLAAE